jgi:hypothetical protein
MTENIKNVLFFNIGDRSQIHKTSNSLIAGPKVKTNLCLPLGAKKFFKNNFTASAAGCKIPPNEGLLGPSRLCLYPKIFRSSKVIKAMFTKIKIININLSKIIDNIITLEIILSHLQSDALNKLQKFTLLNFLSIKNSKIFIYKCNLNF